MAGTLLAIVPPMAQWLAFDTWHRIFWVTTYILAAGAVYCVVLLILGVRPKDLKSS
jgi:putative peptidoglycan lipid II flippase